MRFQTAVELYWKAPDGGEVRERAHTEDVSRTGALLCLRDYWKDLPRGCEVAVKHALLRDFVEGRVVEVRQLSGGKFATVALELLEPVLWDQL
jgi:hypothetical protein